MTGPSPDPQHVALAIDGSYLPWAATVLSSHLRHHPGANTRFHVLHGGDISAHDKFQLTGMVERGGGELDLHLVAGSRLDGLPPIDRFGRVVWMRILLPELLPEQPRCLYLDADTLVTGALDTLWRIDLGGAPVAAVANVVEPALRPHVAELGIADPTTFFNSGVLLFNLAVMRAERSFEAVVQAVDQHRDRLVWPDQDALNVAFAGRWLRLHPRWNAQNSFWAWRTWAEEVFGDSEVREATSDPAIRHFEGPSLSKPWHYLCPHPHVDEYRRTLAITPWASTPLVDRTWATRAVRRLPERRRVPAYLHLRRTRHRAGGP